MSVTERLMGQGNFSVNFSQEFTPTEIIESIKEWGHIVITPNEIDINTLSDSDILSTSRYTGIVLNRALEEGIVSINGTGLQLYLGDGNSKGMVIAESKNIGKVRVYTNTTLSESLFNSTVSSGKPFGIMRDESGNTQAITQGTIYEPSSTYIGQHFVQTALGALKEITEYLNVEYRVNANATLDAGPPANLFNGVNSDPSTIVVKTGYGEDPNFDGVVPQGLRTEFDATDWVSRVDFIGEVGYFDSATDVAGEANIASNPYKDLHGNALKRVGLVQEPEVPTDQLNSRAQLMLTELSRVKKVLNLDLEQYEVSGDMKPGDYIFAFDPDIGFVDTSTDATAESRDLYEVTFRGQVITPVKVRVVGLTFPITNGMGVYFRDKDGNYTDLTQYVQFEAGAAQVELGDVIRFVGDDMRFDEFSLNEKTSGVFSIPDLPSTPTLQSGTYLNATGDSIGFIRVGVSKPTNVDGSQITDGSHYRVRYKKTTDNQYSYVNFPFTGASTESLLIQDLTVGFTYDVGVAVVDKSGFKKMSSYDGSGEDLYTNSSSVNANYATNARIEIEKDGQAPSKPKTATIAAGPLRVQVTHYLGKDGTDGNGNPYGNFTLEGDVDHLDIHAVDQDGNVQDFTVNTANKIGEIRVTSGNLLQAIPVIGTIEVEDSVDKYFRVVAVDKSGNESDPSDGQAAGGNLIAEANISDATITTAKIGDAQITTAKIGDAQITSAKVNDLSADKLTSGSIIGGEIIVGGVSNTSGFIKSYNYSSGSAGWQISPDGSAEFQNATIRGTLNASDITAGTLNVNALTSDGSIDGDKITANSITTNQLNFTPLDSTDLDDYVEISALANGNLAITTSGAVQISGSLEVTGTITANAGFVSGVNIVPTSTTSAVNMNASSSLTSNLTASSGGTFRTASSGARVEIGQSGSDAFAEFFNSSAAVQLQVGLNANTTSYIASTSNPLKLFASGVTEAQSTIQLNADVIDLTKQASTGRPKLLIDGGTGTTTLNKALGIDTNGNIAFGTVSSGYTDWEIFTSDTYRAAVTSGERVTWNAGSGLSVGFNATNQVITYSANIGTGSGQVAEGNHSHGSHDHDGDYVDTVSGSTDALTISGRNITLNFGTTSTRVAAGNHSHSGMVTSVGLGSSGTGFLTSVTTIGNAVTLNTTNTDDSTIHVGSLDPSFTSSDIGNSNSDRFADIYAANHHGGIFYGTLINSSSQNVKENIADNTLGLDFINSMVTKQFNYITADHSDLKYTGMIAEDLKTVLSDNSWDGYYFVEDIGEDKYQYFNRCSHVVTCTCEDTNCCPEKIEKDYYCSNDCCSSYFKHTNDRGETRNYLHHTVEECEAYEVDGNRHPHINYYQFIGPLIKSVQELSQQNADLLARIEVLEGG